MNNRKPGPLPIQSADVHSAYSCALQICAALYAIKSNNAKQGTIIDISMFDVSVASLIMPVSDHFHTKKQVSGGIDLLSGSACCYDIYETKSGYLSVGCLEPHFWIGFMKTLGFGKEYFGVECMFAQGEKKEELKKKIELILKEKSAREWEELLAYKMQLPILALRKPEDLANDELLEIRRLTSQVDSKTKVINPGLDYSSFLKGKQLIGQGPPLSKL